MKSDAKKQAENREAAKKQEEIKRKAKERAERKVVKEPCLYCGKPTRCQDYIINPDADHELPCCSEECFEKTKAFVEYDKRYRKVFYVLLFLLVVTNLLLLGFGVNTGLKYLPMLCFSVAAGVFPLVFIRYERYQRFGILKTKLIIRIVAAVIAAFALALILGI